MKTTEAPTAGYRSELRKRRGARRGSAAPPSAPAQRAAALRRSRHRAARGGHRASVRGGFEALAARDACVEASGALETVAVSLSKVASDLRWMASGPRSSLGEIALPSLPPGRSIRPGKVNPVIPESVLQVAAQVIGNDPAISVAGTVGTGGNLERRNGGVPSCTGSDHPLPQGTDAGAATPVDG